MLVGKNALLPTSLRCTVRAAPCITPQKKTASPGRRGGQAPGKELAYFLRPLAARLLAFKGFILTSMEASPLMWVAKLQLPKRHLAMGSG